MKKITITYCVFGVVLQLLFCSIMSPLHAQQTENIFLEKVYTHTDRSFYFPGETIWFKSYIVDENNHATTLSDIVYAELISPKGSVVDKIRLSINYGYAYGDFKISEDWVGGIYKVKMYTNYMLNLENTAPFTKEITVQKVIKPKVLLSLDFEKESYGKGGEVAANFKVEDVKNRPIRNANIQYKVKVKGEEIYKQEFLTNEEGKAVLNFKLPDDLNTTDIVLNVIVPYKGDRESISRSVPVVLNTIDLQFFPEGGTLLANAENRLAFKAINEFGKPVDITGEIVDEQGELVSSFESFHDGMGAVDFNPLLNTEYYAVIKTPFLSKEKIRLPKAVQNGVNIRIKSKGVKTTVHINSRLHKSLKLKVFSAGRQIVTKNIALGTKIIELNTQKFPVGIAKFQIIDENNIPHAERLVFLNPKTQLSVAIALDKEIYETREKVKVSIATTDENKNPIPANLSIAVVDNKLVSFADDKQDHILSHLLLSSELKGKIHKPSFYFNPEEEKSYEAIDYVMLTHGWRTYIKKPIKKLKGLKYAAEKLTVHYGRITDFKGKPKKAKLLLFNELGKKVLAFETDDNGNFSFKYGSTRYLKLIAYSDDKENVVIHDVGVSKQRRRKSFVANVSENENRRSETQLRTDFQNIVEREQTNDDGEGAVSVMLQEDGAALEEVVVVSAYNASATRSTTGAITSVTQEDLPNNESIAQVLQGRVGGVEVQNGTAGNSSSISIRGWSSISGNNQPLIIIDGVPYKQDVLSNLNGEEVHSVKVFKDNIATSLYGSNAVNGVVVVTTKSRGFNSNWGKKRLQNAKYNNYSVKDLYNRDVVTFYRAKVFYVPKYNTSEKVEKRTDFRQTIYWNPVVQTNEKGKAKFEFYNSDAITSFQVLAEGVGANGLIGRQKKNYATRKYVNVALKSPNYMTIKDTILLPLVITNELKKEVKGKLSIIVPPQIKLLESFEEDLTIGASSSFKRNIKIVPVDKVSHENITVAFESESYSDNVAKEVTVVSPYYPTRLSISESKSKSYRFKLNNPVPNSVKADFTVYVDVVGDIMNGVESIIREPYGCFEQVSSATYPNVLVLNYLKETGKSNPEIEKKAIRFIKKGYKKLAGYETSKDGFEWYGEAPPHEALTAYGLMEFTEMEQVFSGVSKAMLKRTINYLLSRRDGRGGFKQNRGKYGFSAAPEDVNNAYIVYAISTANANVDIEKEYNTALEVALKTKDTYKMALLALASYNLKKYTNANRLLKELKANIEEYSFSSLPVSQTITRSYGDAKNIETLAFTLLALMRDYKENDFLITQGIEKLVSKRTYGRFGSTQSTSMALKALIEYTKNYKRKLVSEKHFATIYINGEKIKTNLSITASGKVTIENLEQYLVDGKVQDLRIDFTNKDATFPYEFNVNYDSFLPSSSLKSPLSFVTKIVNETTKVGENVSMEISVSNIKKEYLGMVTSIVGIPSGASLQPWQLKELKETKQVAYYEVFDNYLVLYWRSFQKKEEKKIRLDLKAEVPGVYTAPASTAYLYYGDEFKTWIKGSELKIE